MYWLALCDCIQVPAPVTCRAWPFLSQSLTTPLCPYQLPGTSFCLFLLLLSHHFRLLPASPRASPGIFSSVLEPVPWLLTWFVSTVHTQTQVFCPASLLSSELILCLSQSFFRLHFGLVSAQLCTETTCSLSLEKDCGDCSLFKDLQMLVLQKPIVKWNLG